MIVECPNWSPVDGGGFCEKMGRTVSFGVCAYGCDLHDGSWRFALRAEIEAFRPQPVQEIPFENWTAPVLLIWRFRSPADAGVGDTVERLLGKAGEAFKAAYESLTGKPCGCESRKIWLNTLYPYR